MSIVPEPLPEPSSRSPRSRVIVLCSIAAAALFASTFYVLHRSASGANARSFVRPALPNVELEAALARLRTRPYVVFLEPQDHARPRIAFAPLADLEHGRIVTEIEAERVYAAGQRLVCLGSFPGAEGRLEDGAFVLDENLRLVRTIPLIGLPSRVRASRDGTLAAVTLFVKGDSYAGAGFSTRTYVFDLDGRGPIRDLEKLKIKQGEIAIDSPDMNFWGVTFDEPPTRILVTLRSGDTRWLVDASLEKGEGREIHARVECPSLSPDRTRLAYKRLANTLPLRWRIATLDLASDKERVLAGETRSIDDQVEWLDATHVVYAVSEPDARGVLTANLWCLDVDSEEPAQAFLSRAQSPCIVRP